MSKKFTGRGFSGKGYYIALILCAAAIGISGYLYYQNTNDDPSQLQNPTPTVDSPDLKDPGVDVIATDPNPTQGGQSNTTPTKPLKKPMKTGLPVSGETVAGYAMDCLSYNATTRDWRTHNGMDIAAEAGTAVCAAADGTVYTTYDDDSMGMTVVIQHEDGYTTKYSSLASEVKVAPGDTVTVGQVIGTVGDTALLETALGTHVHFSVTYNDEPMDPAEFLGLE